MKKTILNCVDITAASQQMDAYIDSGDGVADYCERLRGNTGETPVLTAQLYYVIGTGYSAIYSARLQSEWYSQAIKNAIYFLRKALHELIGQTEPYYLFKVDGQNVRWDTSELRSKININLAEYLARQNRYLEALSFYDEAIKNNNALGCVAKSHCLIKLNHHIDDENSIFFFYKEAYNLAKLSFSPESTATASEQVIFENCRDRLTPFINWFEKEYPKYIDSDHSDTYQQKYSNRKMKSYFHWVGTNRLFLNFTNASITKEYAYEDSLGLPGFSQKFNKLLSLREELAYHSHHDEIKNDYCYARYLYYSALQMPEDVTHFYNSTWRQVDSFDGAIINLKVSHYRTALRVLYACLDKLAYFIYNYFEIDSSDLKKTQVYFKDIFVKDKKPRSWMKDRNNPYLKALYFLSLDLNDLDKGVSKDDIFLSETTFPVPNNANEIRNALEHRSLKIVDDIYCEYLLSDSSDKGFTGAEVEQDLDDASGLNQDKLNDLIREKNRLKDYSFSLTLSDIEQQIFELLKLSNTALMYLYMAIKFDEDLRADDQISFPRDVPYK